MVVSVSLEGIVLDAHLIAADKSKIVRGFLGPDDRLNRGLPNFVY